MNVGLVGVVEDGERRIVCVPMRLGAKEEEEEEEAVSGGGGAPR